MKQSVKIVRKKFSEIICDALRDLIPFVQFQKLEKYPWMSVIFSKLVG